MKISLRNSGLVYILLLSIAFHMVNINEFIKAIFAIPGFFIVPYLFGFGIFHIVGHFFNLPDLTKDLISKSIIFWFLGTLLLTIIIVAAQFFGLHILIKNFHILILLTLLITAITNPKSSATIDSIFNINGYSDNKHKVLNLILILSIPIVVIIIAKSYIPFQTNGWAWMNNVMQYQLVIRSIDTGFLMANRIPTIIMILSNSMIFNIDPLSSMWCMPIAATLVFGIGFYLFGYHISKNVQIAILCEFFGLFIMTFNGKIGKNIFTGIPISSSSPTAVIMYATLPILLFFILQYMENLEIRNKKILKENLFLMFFLFIVIIIYFLVGNIDKLTKLTPWSKYCYLVSTIFISFLLVLFLNKFLFTFEKIKHLLFISFIIISVLYLSHPEEAGVYLIIIFLSAGVYFIFKNLMNDYVYIKHISYIIMFIIFVYIFSQILGIIEIETTSPLSKLLYGEKHSSRDFMNFSVKYEYLKYATPTPIFEFLFIGCFVMLLINSNYRNLFVLFMLSITLFIFFLPDTFSTKIFKEITPFMAYTIAFTIYFFIKFPTENIKKGNPNKYFHTLLVLLLIIITLPPTVTPLVERFSTILNQEYYGTTTSYEYYAIKWLKENTGENDRIISDYQTMLIMNPLTNKVWVGDKPMIPEELSKEGYDRMWFIKRDIFLADNSKKAFYSIHNMETEPIHYPEKEYVLYKELGNPRYIVVITPKTSEWIESKDIHPLVFPTLGYINQKHLNLFNNTHYFTRLHNINNLVYIFGINPEPGVPFKLFNNSKS